MGNRLEPKRGMVVATHVLVEFFQVSPGSPDSAFSPEGAEGGRCSSPPEVGTGRAAAKAASFARARSPPLDTHPPCRRASSIFRRVACMDGHRQVPLRHHVFCLFPPLLHLSSLSPFNLDGKVFAVEGSFSPGPPSLRSVNSSP